MPDLGNPNFFTTFKGRYKVTPAEGVTVDNDIVMLTSNNIVCICGDFELAAYEPGAVFAALPDECIPDKDVYVPVAAIVNGTLSTVVIKVSGEGISVGVEDVTTLYTATAIYSINQTIYKET